VLQLPAGFTVVGACNSDRSAMTRDDPALLGLYTAEPGHFLAGWSGASSSTTTGGLLKVFVQAPTGAGFFAVKAALAGQPDTNQPFVANDPPQTSFALITAAPHAQNVLVLPDPVADFALGSNGLPLGSTDQWSGVAFGDIDGDGLDDLAAVMRLGSGPRAWLSLGAGGFLERSGGLAGSTGRSRVAFGDFDADGFLDLADGNGRVFFGDGAGSWTPGPAFALRGGGMEGAAAGDVDGDGFDDVAFSGHFSGFAQVFLSNGGNRTFTEASNGLPNLTVGGVDGGHELLLVDVTGDGLLDLVWTRFYQPNVWAGDGQGNWSPGAGFGPHQFYGAAAGDVDGDGLPELVFGVFDLGSGLGSGGVQIYAHQGSNQWTQLATTGLPSTGSAMGLALLDFDRDGWLDVAVGYYSGGGIELWRNNGGLSFTPVATSGLPVVTAGSVEGLAAGDSNGDTFPELAAAIVGEAPAVYANTRGGLSAYGAPCNAIGFPAPSLRGNGRPLRGNAAFAFELRGCQPAGLGVFWLGTSKRWVNGLPVLPFELGAWGAPGCFLQAEPLATRVGFADGSGMASFPLPIPNAALLSRTTVFGQGACFQPGANALGFLFSGGLAARVE
jgi:hypothetical protein